MLHGRSSDNVAKFDDGEPVAAGKERAEKSENPGQLPGASFGNTGMGDQ
jgi:hypothetical protein